VEPSLSATHTTEFFEPPPPPNKIPSPGNRCGAASPLQSGDGDLSSPSFRPLPERRRHGSGVPHLRRRLRGPRPPLPRRLFPRAAPASASSRSQVRSSPASRRIPRIAVPARTSTSKFNRPPALQRRALLLLGLLLLHLFLLRRVGEVVRLRLGAARPPRRPPPRALRRRLPPPHQP
jgi:hypothetical protein